MQSLGLVVTLLLIVIGIGFWQLLTPLDVLWAQQERRLLARGLAPQRTDAWESSTRMGGIVIIFIGVIMLIMIGSIESSRPVPMSGISINEHQLTQQEWDDCHQDMPTCLSIYTNQHRK